MVPLFTGVLIVLVFSLPGLRMANGALCLGVALGGFVAAYVEGRAAGNRLEATRGLILGAQVGIIASLIAIASQFVAPLLSLSTTLDPIPNYIYAAIYGIYDGLVDEISRRGVDGIEMPGRTAQIMIMLVSTFLFGGFGGGVAASTFVRGPAIDQQREDWAEEIRVRAYRTSQGIQASDLQRRPAAPISVEPPASRDARPSDAPAPPRTTPARAID